MNDFEDGKKNLEDALIIIRQVSMRKPTTKRVNLKFKCASDSPVTPVKNADFWAPSADIRSQ